MISNRQRKLQEIQKKQPKNITNNTLFRKIEREYKHKSLAEINNTEDLLSLDKENGCFKDNLTSLFIQDKINNPAYKRLKDSGCEIKHCYKLNSIPDCLLIENPFTEKKEMQLIKLSLEEYTKSSYINNLNIHYKIPKNGSLLEMVRQKHPLSLKEEPEHTGGLKTKVFEGYVYTGRNEKGEDIKNSSLKHSLDGLDILKKLRWASFGVPYNWTHKKYIIDQDSKNTQDLIGREIKTLCEDIVNLFGLYQNYNVQTGIINYYQNKDSLMAHIDKSEINMTAPLVSISLGNECVFVIGTENTNVSPIIPVRLKSGDIFIMYNQSRKYYHGVPRIIENTFEYMKQNEDDENEEIIKEYMKTTRVNINVRQVI